MRDAPRRLLLVEDDPIGAEWLLHTLRAWGFEVLHAPDCHSALALRQWDALDGALLDQRLPDGDGLALLSLLRRSGLRGPALALSADLDEAQRRRLGEAGFSASLRKPVEPPVLLAALRASGLAPPTWDDSRALASANGHASIARSLRQLMLAELPAQRSQLLASTRAQSLSVEVLDAVLHRLLGSARMTGALALAAQIEITRTRLSSMAASPSSARWQDALSALSQLDEAIADLLAASATASATAASEFPRR